MTELCINNVLHGWENVQKIRVIAALLVEKDQ